MKLSLYTKDKIINIIIYLLTQILITLILYVVKVPLLVLLIINIISILSMLLIFINNYYKKHNFYNNLIKNTNQIDNKVLVLETIKNPTSYEEKIIYDCLYDINKSMNDNINKYKNNLINYKEFLEIWIHEVKIPISSMMLLYHNHKDKYDNKIISIIKKLDDNIDEILYYVRSEDPEKDFMISEVSLKEIVKNVGINNKNDLLENNISLDVNIEKNKLYTDKKWMEFIINQIINNAIKYKKKDNSIIKISSYEEKEKIILEIYDNGIGISKSDINRVFEKSFTGTNGRDKVKSTGMGLYIIKKLISKLGHEINIESKVNEYTKVIIKFGKNNLYKF